MPDPDKLTQKSLSTPTISGQDLTIQRTNGDRIKLTELNLEKWLARAQLSLESHKHEMTPQELDASTPSLATKFLSFYGLKRPLDVIRFLKSPAGEVTLALLREQLAEKAAMIEHIRQDLIEQQRLADRRLACLLLGLMLEDEAQADQTIREAQRTIEKNIKAEEKAAANSWSSNLPTYHPRSILEERLIAYNETIKAIEENMDSTLAESVDLENELAETALHIERTDAKYALFHEHLDAIEQILLSPPDHAEQIQNKVNEITALINTEAGDIGRSLEAGDIETARRKMELNIARNMQVNAFNEILPLQKKLVHHEGKYLLVHAHQNVEDLSHDDKEAGEKAYHNLRPQILGLKQLVQKNLALEQQMHNERKDRLIARSTFMRIEIAFLANQLTKLQAARANVEAFLKAPTPRTANAPTPTPTPSPQGKMPSVSHSYKQMVLKMYSAPLTQQSVDWLKESITNTNTPKSIIDRVNQLRPGIPIPPSLLAALLKRRDAGTLWMNPNSPDIVKNSLLPYPKPDPTPTAVPTPFATKPKTTPY